MDKFIEIEHNVQLLIAAIDAAEGEPVNQEITFLCPICGGVANVFKSSFNGHHHVYCPCCDVKIME